MPKKWIYTKRGKTQNYNSDDLENAVKAVQENGMSVRKAAAHFGVPKSTIGDRISGKHELHVRNGRPPHIPNKIEQNIVDAVKMAARRGIGLTRKQILNKTNILCKKMKISSKYTTFKAGKDWWEGVKRRHPDLVIRKPEKLTSTRARMMNREVIGRYFDDLQTIVEGLNIQHKPNLIWNCDEMGKNFEHEPVRVVAEKGEKTCVSKTSAKSNNMTIMACVSASGRRMPPMFITKGKTSRSLYGFNTSSAPVGTRWCWQKNGWMDDAIGEKWFTEVFLESCGPERPQLLILDGHSSHETLGLLMKAMEENIHILALPPHTTHALQPLDKAVFGPLNRAFNEVCSAYLQESSLHQINKWSFPALFRQAWESAVTPANIQSGFRSCGIYPLDRAIIPEKLYGPSEPTDKPLPVALPPGDQLQLSGDRTVAVKSAEPIVSNRPSSSSSDNVLVASKLSVSAKSSERIDPYINREISPNKSFEYDPNNSTVSLVQSEVDIQTSQDVLDISDPFQLFQLISDGNVVVKPLFDECGNELVIENSGTPISDPLPAIKKNAETDETTKSKVETFFVPPNATIQTKKKQNKKSVTHHRLLTSEDVINEKLRVENIKLEKQKKKQARIEGKSKPNKPVKTEKKSTTNTN